ncbi:MAG: SH3 domain-containing protein [Gemmatimonadaceae bacterium]
MHLLRSSRPALALLLLVATAPSLHAQRRFTADTEVRSAPTGNVVATLRSGTTWAVGATRGGWTFVTIEGWVEASRFTAGRDSFPQTIGGSDILRIRGEPSLNGRILGEFRAGAGLHVTERRGTWARIRRGVWAPAGALVPATTAAASPPTRPPTSPTTPPVPSPTVPRAPAAAPETPPRPGAMRADTAAALRSAPNGALLGALEPGTIVDVQARDRGWAKVRLEAWVAESLLVPADSTYASTLSAAELRLDPEGTRGRVVRWRVQVVGLQTADPLRRDLAPEEPFLLAMGPEGEDAILYLAVPPSLLAEARAIPPLARVLLTARVRAGRSEPTGVPVLDLLSIVAR